MRPLVALVGGIYHADADKLLRTQAEVLALAGTRPRKLVNPAAWNAAMGKIAK